MGSHVCAVNEKGKILGFANTTMDAKKQAENVKKHKFSLGVAALGAIIKHPSLFKEVWIDISPSQIARTHLL